MPATARSADVLIVGAGVIGLSLALELLRAGRRVTVIERGQVGPGGASWAGGGILAPLEPDLSPLLLPLLRDSLARYADWCATLHAETGIDPEYTVSGLRVLPPADVASWRDLAGQCGLQARRDPNGAAAIELPGVAQVRSPRLLRALAAAVRARGGSVCEGEPVQALIGESRVTGVRTAGDEHSAEVVVLAAGAWSAGLSRAAPLRPVRGEMLLLDARPGELDAIMLREGSYLIPRRDGPVLAGSTLEEIGFDHAPSAQGRNTMLAAVRAMRPELAERAVLAHWSGLRPATPDGLPRIGWVEERPGLYLCSGHYRLGITLAPATAHRVAQDLLSRG